MASIKTLPSVVDPKLRSVKVKKMPGAVSITKKKKLPNALEMTTKKIKKMPTSAPY